MQEYNTKYKHKKLLIQGHLSIPTKLNDHELTPSKRIYYVKIFFDLKKLKLYVHLIELLERKIYDAFADIPEELLKQNSKLKKPNYFRELRNYAETVLPTIVVEGIRVHFNDKKMKPSYQEPSDEVTPEKSDMKTGKPQKINGTAIPGQEDKHHQLNATSPDYNHHPMDLDEDDDVYQAFIATNKRKPYVIDVSQRNAAATKVAAGMRGYLARQQYKLLKERRTQVLFEITYKIDGRIIRIKLVKLLKTGPMDRHHRETFIVNGYDFTQGVNFTALQIPDYFLNKLKSLNDVISLVNYLFFNRNVQYLIRTRLISILIITKSL